LLPQAPQFGSEFKLLQVPSHDAIEQQMWLPQDPPMRLVSLLHFWQAARHFVWSALWRHWQKALHGSCPFAHAASIPRGLRIAPAKAAPRRRSDSRRGNDSDSDFENSSNRWSMMGSFSLSRVGFSRPLTMFLVD
jgi:hypothetical protein